MGILFKNAVEIFCDQLKVHKTPYKKIRVGRESDGGYVVLEELCKNTPIALSYGIANDTSFEQDFLSRFPDTYIYAFDHTVPDVEFKHPRFNFRSKGLSVANTEIFRTLANGIKNADSTEYKFGRGLLKMDIEWSEWAVLMDTPSLVFGYFSQIVLELHVIPAEYTQGKHSPYFTEFHKNVHTAFNEMIFGVYGRALQNLQQTHRAVHIHANNSLPPNDYGTVKIPPLLEITFARRCDTLDELSGEKFPVDGLDFPNKPYKPEIVDFYPFEGVTWQNPISQP